MIVRRFLILLGLLAGAAALVSSCRDATPVGVDARTPVLLAGRHAQPQGGDDSDDGDDPAEPPDDENEDSDSLVSCRPLRYESVTQTIGPAGGTIEVRHNWLVVPRGALRAPVTITAVAPSDTVAMVRFQPEGLRFQKSALLVLAYDNCRIPKSVTPRIALVTDAFQVIEFLTSANVPRDDNRFKKVHARRHVIGELQHFSNYAVAW
jgi:hypothetical protein